MATQAERPWYYRTWFLWVTFLFATPIWSILVIRSPYITEQWLRIAGWVFLVLYIGLWLLICLGGGLATILAGSSGGSA